VNDQCVCCGAIVPEGTQVCPSCNAKVYTKLPDRWLLRDVPKGPRPYKRRIGYGYTCWQCGREVNKCDDVYCPGCGQRLNWDAVWLHEREILGEVKKGAARDG